MVGRKKERKEGGREGTTEVGGEESRPDFVISRVVSYLFELANVFDHDVVYANEIEGG